MSILCNWFDQVHYVLRAILLLGLGFFVAKIISSSISKAISSRVTAQHSMLLRRIVFYSIFLLFFASAVQELGFHISALLGATGILTVAIGIASQASMSNVVSGVFIIGEKPFQIGDTIKVNDLQGEIISIDFLSVKIRTSENTMVRIPNEVLIKTPVINISYFPVRRIDLIMSVAYKSDLEKVKKLLFDIAKKNQFCLSDPKPSFYILGFADSVINIQFSVWGKKENYYDLKNSFFADIQNYFIAENIDTNKDPLSIKIINQE